MLLEMLVWGTGAGCSLPRSTPSWYITLWAVVLDYFPCRYSLSECIYRNGTCLENMWVASIHTKQCLWVSGDCMQGVLPLCVVGLPAAINTEQRGKEVYSWKCATATMLSPPFSLSPGSQKRALVAPVQFVSDFLFLDPPPLVKQRTSSIWDREVLHPVLLVALWGKMEKTYRFWLSIPPPPSFCPYWFRPLLIQSSLFIFPWRTLWSSR